MEYEIMEGMDKVNHETQIKWEKDNPVPICHFQPMKYVVGEDYVECQTCSHTKEVDHWQKDYSEY